MILTLRTKKDRDRAAILAREAVLSLNETIRDLKSLQALFSRVHDFGMQNSLAHYAITLEEIQETEGGEAGLRPFLRELLATIKKGDRR